jgi:hypothetical protein
MYLIWKIFVTQFIVETILVFAPSYRELKNLLRFPVIVEVCTLALVGYTPWLTSLEAKEDASSMPIRNISQGSVSPIWNGVPVYRGRAARNRPQRQSTERIKSTENTYACRQILCGLPERRNWTKKQKKPLTSASLFQPKLRLHYKALASACILAFWASEWIDWRFHLPLDINLAKTFII